MESLLMKPIFWYANMDAADQSRRLWYIREECKNLVKTKRDALTTCWYLSYNTDVFIHKDCDGESTCITERFSEPETVEVRYQYRWMENHSGVAG